MIEYDYASKLQIYIDSMPFKSDKSKLNFLIGYSAKTYSFIEYAIDLLDKSLQEGDIDKLKEEISRTKSFLSSVLHVSSVDADNKNPFL